ncbi:hypothetical protein ACEZCY_16040 [Streptacidiphilus sp. N1-12]|uniref:Uncharacterized protein n=2 Tax=Streptacidiphilus alkalitolerans TaxID=3342712 RepID=A0ABV6WFB9_9ACTN
MRRVEDFFITRLLQEAAIELVSTPAWDRRLRRLSAALRERCAVLVEALAREVPDWTVTWMPVGARAHGVALNSGSRYSPTEPPTTLLRLGFAAAASPVELAEGALHRRSATTAPSRGNRPT